MDKLLLLTFSMFYLSDLFMINKLYILILRRQIELKFDCLINDLNRDFVS